MYQFLIFIHLFICLLIYIFIYLLIYLKKIFIYFYSFIYFLICLRSFKNVQKWLEFQWNSAVSQNTRLRAVALASYTEDDKITKNTVGFHTKRTFEMTKQI